MHVRCPYHLNSHLFKSEFDFTMRLFMNIGNNVGVRVSPCQILSLSTQTTKNFTHILTIVFFSRCFLLLTSVKV